MKSILIELERVEKLIEKEPDFFIHQRFQTDMEWWVIGRTARILSEINSSFPAFAEKTLVPDFRTLDVRRNEFNLIEVTEALLPGRKRVEEYKKEKEITDWSHIEWESIDPIENPWITLINCLNKKFSIKYPPHTWLIIYLNISYVYISEHGYWHQTLLANAVQWNLGISSFERVLVLDSTGKALVELFPKMVTIKPEI